MFKKLIILISLCFIYVTPAHAIDGFITITNPNSGTYTEGDTVNITWNSSSNIDQVNIGYKSCPSCLDWVVFTMPNTGSYNWKVDVGNTTKTQFYLQITGYETGKGSLTSNSGTFTVNQNPPLSTTSPSQNNTQASSQPASSTTPSSNNYSGITYPSNYPRPTPTPTPRPFSPTLTVYTLLLYQEFYFEGSSTTNLKEISDPKHVDNFTLDTQSGFTFIFQETLDLTDPKTLSALQNTKDYWEYESWFIWIEWEWWIKYDIQETVTVEYNNENLTGYTPQLIEEPRVSPSPSKNKTVMEKHKPPVVLGAESGKVKLAINDGTPVKIAPKVELNTPKSPVFSSRASLTGHTSHSNLIWTLSKDDIKTTVNPSINSSSGEFVLEIENLNKGPNTYTLSYQLPGEDSIALNPVTVQYDPSFWDKYGSNIILIIIFTFAFLTGIFFPQLIGKAKKKLKVRKHK